MTASCRVLHLVNSLDPGGMENGVVNMAQKLGPVGFEIHVGCLEREGAFGAKLPEPRKIHLLGKRGGFSPATILRLHRLLRRLRPDLLHTHNLGPLIYGSLATLFGATLPILHGEHSQLTAEERSPKRLRQRRLLYRGCRVVHCVSAGIQAELLRLGFPRKLLVLTMNGVDTRRFEPGNRLAARERFGIPAQSVVIGIVGRFGPFKGHRILLDAFDLLAPLQPALHLLIAGCGGSEEAATAERVQGSPFRERIHWLGFQENPAGCYQALDLLALPSTNEGLSNAALEAMATGVPVLGNTGCGHEQIISHGRDGLVADLGNAALLARELALLLANPEKMKDYGARAKEKALAHFSIDAMAATYAELYRSVAGLKQ